MKQIIRGVGQDQTGKVRDIVEFPGTLRGVVSASQFEKTIFARGEQGWIWTWDGFYVTSLWANR